MELSIKYRTILTKAGIDTPLRLAHFFAQIHHESNLKPVQENLNYSAQALIRVFKRYFKSYTEAKEYARKPEKIANKVYANRMKNGPESSGDGWRFRGRGFIQITGRYNYTELSKDTGIDYVSSPNLLLTEADSMVSAIWYWTRRNLNKYADKDDIYTITKRINGGYNGFRHRQKLLKHYKEVFNTEQNQSEH